jgi:hypothetical protein
MSRTNISDGHPNKNSNDRRSDSNDCCHIVFKTVRDAVNGGDKAGEPRTTMA